MIDEQTKRAVETMAQCGCELVTVDYLGSIPFYNRLL